MKPAGVHHVSINVSDVDAAKDFYVDVLGLTERSDRPDFGFGGAWLDLGGQQVHLIEGTVPDGSGSTSPSRCTTSTTWSPSCAAAASRSATQAVATSRQSFLKDPSGNLVELQQPG